MSDPDASHGPSPPSDDGRERHPERRPTLDPSLSFRRRTSGLAVAAVVLSLGGPWLGLFLAPRNAPAREKVLPLLAIASAALALSIIASIRIGLARKRLAGLDASIVSVLISVGVLLLGVPFFYNVSVSLNTAECRSDLEQIGSAFQMYFGEWEGLPLADRWSDSLLRDFYDASIFVCPEAPKARSGYAMNSALSGVSAATMMNKPGLDKTVLLFESDLGWNGAGGPEALVKRPRHAGRDVFVFADGSVRILERKDEAGLIWRP